MPKEVVPIIERLTRLRDDLQLRSQKVWQAAGFKNTSEVLELIDQWGKVKDRLQEIESLNSSIDLHDQYVAEGDENALHPIAVARYERDKAALKNKLKTVNRLETKGNELLSSIPAPQDEPAPKEEPAPKKEPPPKDKKKKAAAVPKPEPAPEPEPNVPPRTPVDEYLQDLNELKAAAERAILAKLPSLERYAYDLMVEFVDANLDTVNGKLVPNEAALRALNTFVDQYLGAFTQSAAYQGNVAAFLKNFKDIGTLAIDFQASRGVDVEKARLGDVQAIVQNEIVNQYGENGLNQGFAQPLRELLYNNVTGGLDKKQAMAQLREYIDGGRDTTGKLHRYLQQTAQQGVDSYTGAINVRIMQTFKISTMIMSGSLIKTSSPQCRYCITKLGGLIDRADWPAVEELANKNGLIAGTTFDNLPFNKLHWGCRHEFTPAVLSDAERSQISKPTNE